VLSGIDHVYRVVLGWSVRHKLAVAGIAFLSLVGMVQILKLTGNEFVNAEDRGQFVVDVELPAGTSLEETAKLTAGAEKELLQDKRIVTLLSTLGPDGDVSKASWRVVAVPKADRDVGVAVLKEEARQAVRKIHGAKVAVADPAFVEGVGTEAPIMIQVRAATYDELEPLARKFENATKAIPGVTDVQMKYTPGRPELRVAVDRDAAARAGIQASTIAMTVRTSIEGDEAGKLRQGKDEVPIRVRLDQSDRRDVEDVMRMTMWTQKGPMALGDLATVDRGEGPNVIEREDRERQIVIWAFPLSRPLGEIVPELDAAFAKIKLPPGASYHYDGQVRQMNETNGSMGLALMLAVIFIYIVLASQFESFIHPFTIMLTLPLALVGAVVALFLARITLAMGAMIGIILLMGLVTKNAILLLDRALVRVREHGETPMQAVLEAGPERLRPILMTSAAMILGMLPTAISNGEGSEFRAPMAIAVIGGVISSTLLSLVVVPAFYLAIENAKGKLAKWLGIKPRVEAAPAPAE
ncbi:MAG: efflux RND transporter permease subunit, partial [Polyangiaceae bacterium]